MEFDSIKSSLYAQYVTAHAHRKSFEKNYLIGLMTNIMSRNSMSWRVVGITPAALAQFREQNGKYVPGCGITRAHITPREKLVAHVMERDVPLSESEFIRYWLENDRTVLCARGENRETVPPHIAIHNPFGELFRSKKVAGFHVRAAERQVLQHLN